MQSTASPTNIHPTQQGTLYTLHVTQMVDDNASRPAQLTIASLNRPRMEGYRVLVINRLKTGMSFDTIGQGRCKMDCLYSLPSLKVLMLPFDSAMVHGRGDPRSPV